MRALECLRTCLGSPGCSVNHTLCRKDPLHLPTTLLSCALHVCCCPLLFWYYAAAVQSGRLSVPRRRASTLAGMLLGRSQELLDEGQLQQALRYDVIQRGGGQGG